MTEAPPRSGGNRRRIAPVFCLKGSAARLIPH